MYGKTAMEVRFCSLLFQVTHFEAFGRVPRGTLEMERLVPEWGLPEAAQGVDSWVSSAGASQVRICTHMHSKNKVCSFRYWEVE